MRLTSFNAIIESFAYSWSGHVAFPGGKNEPQDKSDLDTVVRECREEIGIDLSSPNFIPLGTLEHRDIKNIKLNKLMMVLIPHGNLS